MTETVKYGKIALFDPADDQPPEGGFRPDQERNKA